MQRRPVSAVSTKVTTQTHVAGMSMFPTDSEKPLLLSMPLILAIVLKSMVNHVFTKFDLSIDD